jgi:hypothetical protein
MQRPALRHSVAAVTFLRLALAASPGAAQVPVTPDTTLGDTILVNQALQGPVDSFRIHLTKGGQYRVALWPANARVEGTLQGGRATAFAPRIREGVGTHPTVIELYPPQTGEYLLVTTLPTGLSGGTMQLWSDRKLASSRQEARDRTWGIGLGLTGEVYSAYSTVEGYAEEGGTGVGGCVLFGSSGPLSGCLGFDYQARSGETGSLTWFFIEPRFRVLTTHAFGHPMDLLASLRLGQGHQSRLSVDPNLIAPGVLLAYHLDDRPGARGWRLVFQVYGALVGNTTFAQKPTFASASLGVTWIP